jgi:hypothetical protein
MSLVGFREIIALLEGGKELVGRFLITLQLGLPVLVTGMFIATLSPTGVKFLGGPLHTVGDTAHLIIAGIRRGTCMTARED